MTRRPLAWTLLFLLTLPTVMAGADMAQRATTADMMTTIAHLREGAVYVYDADFRSVYNDIDTTIPRYLTIRVGTVQDVASTDGASHRAIPVTLETTASPWDFGAFGRTSGDEDVEAGTFRTTQWYRTSDGVQVLRVDEEDVVYREAEEDGEGAVTWKRITSDAEIRRSVGLGGSMVQRGFFPGHTILNGNVVGEAMFSMLGVDHHVARQVGTWDGRTVYDVGHVEWTGNQVGAQYRCDIAYPELDFTDFAASAAAQTLFQWSRETRSVWMDPLYPFPVHATCLSEYRKGGSDGATLERIERAIRLVDVQPGGAEVPIDWATRTYYEADATLPTEPVLLPGLPHDFGLDLLLPLESVVEALLHDPALAQVRRDADPPVFVTRASYDPAPAEASPQEPTEPPATPDPFGLVNGTPPTEPYRTHIPKWRLTVFDGVSAHHEVRFSQTHWSDGSIDPLTIEVDPAQAVRAEPRPTEFAAHLTPFKTLLNDWATEHDEDLEAWQDTHTRLEAQHVVHERSDGERLVRHTGGVARQTPSADGATTQIIDSGYDTSEGRVTHQRHMARAQEDVNGPTGASPPPRISASAATVTPYVPVAAASSGLLVAVAFALTYGWGHLKQAGVQGGMVLYAKIRKDKVLDHKVRDAIMEYLAVNPGASVSEIQRHLAVGYGTTVHHLGTLERNGLLKGVKTGRERRYFAPGALDASAMPQAALLNAEAPRRVLEAIVQRPGATQRELAAAIGTAGTAVRFHARRLEEVGLVRCAKDGRRLRHFATDAALGQMQGAHLPAAAASEAAVAS